MFTYKNLGMKNVEVFWVLLNSFDNETKYMLYEPKERQQRMKYMN